MSTTPLAAMAKPAANWADAAEEADEQASPPHIPLQPQRSQRPAPTNLDHSSSSSGGDRYSSVRRNDDQPRRQYNDNYSRDDRRGGSSSRGGYDSERRGGGRDYNDSRSGAGGASRDYNESRGGGSRYEDRRSGGGRDYNDSRPSRYNEDRPAREPRDAPPLPDKAPFKAYFSNLPLDVTEQELVKFCDPAVVVSSYVVKTRESVGRGAAFVEFETREDLAGVIENYHGMQFGGQAVTIQVARQKTDREPRGDYQSSREGGSSSYREPRAERTGFSSLERRTRRDSERSNPDQPRGGRPERPQLDDATANMRAGIVEATPESLAGRPKLKLAPRASVSKPADAPAAGSRSSIFGDARPREAVLAERGPASPEKTATSPPQSSSSLDKSASDSKSATTDSAGKYQAKQPSAASAQRDYKARQSQPADKQQNGGETGKKERHDSTKAAERATKAFNRQNEEKPIISASNAFAGLGVDDDDNTE